MKSILTEIIKNKIKWIHNRKKRQPLTTFRHKIVQSNYNFKKSLQEIHPSFILEIKKASPTLGIINNSLDLKLVASIYKEYASSISVLTDEKYFHGKFEFIPIVRKIAPNRPILCKDFFIDDYQIYLARYYQADAILLMLSILNDNQYMSLKNLAQNLNMDVLTEISNLEELNRALNLRAKIIGINNRDLHNFSIDINKTKKLAPLIPKNVIIISESGIKNYNQVRSLQSLVQGFLIGSHLMQTKNIKTEICKIIIGNNKICGLTKSSDAEISKKCGIIYGGFIFCKSSLRYIDYKKAYLIAKNVNLKYVGVFCNENISKINYISTMFPLCAIQLHGSEDQTYINNLKKIIPQNIQVWKAITYSEFISKKYIFNNVNKYIIDNKYGGSGKSFKWDGFENQELNNFILAGGLNIKNCILATNLNFFGFDFNSGLEILPGIKCKQKIIALTQTLRTHTIIDVNY